MKGIFYSATILLFITPLILLTLSNVGFYKSQSDITTTKIIGDKLASYSKSVDADIERAFQIMAKRSITSAVVYVENSGTPLTDSSLALTELITQGTIYGNMTSTNFTVDLWASILTEKGRSYGFETNITVFNITFYSYDSYHIGASVHIIVNASNPSKHMELYRIYNSTIIVPITDFDDPLYTLNTNGILKRTIKRPTTSLSGALNFDAAVSQEYYMTSEKGPGFLDRLEGRLVPSGKYNTTSSSAGLESVVYLPSLESNGIAVDDDQTDIDYLYFNTTSYPGSQVNGSSFDWLMLDNDRLAKYNLTAI